MPIWTQQRSKGLILPLDTLDVKTHTDPERHLIGEALGSPSIILPVGNTSRLGSSPYPAREDHSHGSSQLYFASNTERDAYTEPKTKNTFAYVESATEYGIAAPTNIRYKWDGSAWKVWDLPADGTDQLFPCALTSASAPNPTLGAGGGTSLYGTIRGRLFYGHAHTYWGTTAGTIGTGTYRWSHPFTFNISVGFKIQGTAYLYRAGTTIIYVGAVRLSSTAGNNFTAILTGSSVDVSSTSGEGGTGHAYYLDITGAPLASTSA